eukprot:TRINITY_DN1459_c0_g1_i12.p1 TRINITY_DN1459_c0_g1~~TRINITY_DN1459_c0_g1_i12.p1  ORF type:complete len:304 (+),score=103.14 TRINITY_DN1459_c0_g1_i12:308-1219(+)
MANNMYEFFQVFFTKYPKYSNLRFFVTGESYAGHYVPAVAARIFRGNQAGEGIHINLSGIAIGNGLVNPAVQYTKYAPYAHDHQLVNDKEYGLMNAMLPLCEVGIVNCAQNSTLGWLACINAYVICNAAELMPVTFTGVNPYDVRTQCTVQPLCYDFTLLPKFLQKPDVIQALGVQGHTWTDCNRLVTMELVFAGDWMLNFASDIPQLLTSNISVLVYNGEYDFMCNWYGSQAWTEALVWSGQIPFQQAQNQTWVVDGQTSGSFKSYGGFTFLRVADSGHMVPRDQPKRALTMINNFVHGSKL